MDARNLLRTFYLSLFAFTLSCAPWDASKPLGSSTGEAPKSDETVLDLTDLYTLAHQVGLPERALTDALNYLEDSSHLNLRKDHMGIIDFDQHSTQRRFYLIDLKRPHIEPILTSHGVNSDPENTGYAHYFSNISGSRMSSVGFYRVAERYVGKYGPSLRMDGLEATNSLARPRAIVIHQAVYVDEDAPWAGRSWGCPAVDERWIGEVIQRLRDGGLLYIYVDDIDEHRKEASLSPITKPSGPMPDESEDAPFHGE